MIVRYVGDKPAINCFGLTFQKGVDIDVSGNVRAMERLPGNQFFVASDPVKPKPLRKKPVTG